MENQELIYARVKLINPPNGKRLHITKDCTQIFYYNNKEKVYISTHEENQIKQNFDFMKTKLVSEGTNGWYKILLDVNINMINNALRHPYNICGRKNLFDIFKKCYNESKNNYISHLILNLYESILTGQQDNNIFGEWFKLKELKKGETYRYMPSNTYKISTFYADLLKGQFLNEVKMHDIKFNGGIIYDTTYVWIEQILKNINEIEAKKDINHKKDINITFVYSKCTLIICDKSMCAYWTNKITLININAKIKIINTCKDHKNLKYSDIIELDYLIINCDYLLNKKYMSMIDDYNINNNSLKEIISIIKKEFETFENIKSKTDVILSLIDWNRIIVDSISITNFIKDSYGYELLETLTTKNKWIQIDKMPTNHDDYVNIFKYIVGDSDVTFPLYNNDSIVYLDNLMYVFEQKENTKMIIKEKCITVKSGKLEKAVISYINSSKCTDTNKFYEIINILYENTISRQAYVDILDTINMSAEFDNLDCSICFNECEQEDMLFTECGHYYCISCILQNLDYNSDCPMCRKKLELKNLHYVDDNCTNDKADELIRTIRNINDKVYVYVTSVKHKRYMAEYLDNYGISNIEWLYGNDMSKIQLAINNSSCSRMNIIFYDICGNTDEIKKQLRLRNFENANIYYFIYDILKDKAKRQK